MSQAGPSSTPGISGVKTSYVATEEAITSGALAYMPTPDKVTGIVVKPGGFLCACFTGFWHASQGGTCQAVAALAVNDAQLQGLYQSGSGIVAPTSHAPSNGSTSGDGSCNSGAFAGSSFYRPIYTVPEGLATDNSSPGAGGDCFQSAAPQLMGDVSLIWVPPAGGTFSVGILWRLITGAFKARERRLAAWAVNP